jgi:hypothetical protein
MGLDLVAFSSSRRTSPIVPPPASSHAGTALRGLLCKLVAAGVNFIANLLDDEDAHHSA